MSVSVRKLRRFRKESECRVHNVCTTAFLNGNADHLMEQMRGPDQGFGVQPEK